MKYLAALILAAGQPAMTAIGGVIGWLAWGMTAWQDSKTSDPTKGAAGLIVVLGVVLLALSLYTLWVHEEARDDKTEKVAKRIADLEKEIGL